MKTLILLVVVSLLVSCGTSEPDRSRTKRVVDNVGDAIKELEIKYVDTSFRVGDTVKLIGRRGIDQYYVIVR